MINIKTNYTSNLSINPNIKNSSDVSDQSNNDNNVNNTTQNATKADTIIISDASKNLTDAQKVKKAFDDTYAEFSQFKNFDYDHGDMSMYVADMISVMTVEDIHPIPTDILSNPNSKYSFLTFVDKLKSVAQNQKYIQLPKQFFDFCDKLKQNMILNGVQ